MTDAMLRLECHNLVFEAQLKHECLLQRSLHILFISDAIISTKEDISAIFFDNDWPKHTLSLLQLRDLEERFRDKEQELRTMQMSS